jgi:hypothetical protein
MSSLGVQHTTPRKKNEVKSVKKGKFAYGRTLYTNSDTLQSHIVDILEKFQGNEGYLLLIAYAITSEF